MSWIQFLRRALGDVAALWLVGLLALCVGHEAGAAAPAGITIGNQATATYSDGGSVTRTVTSNTVLTTVQQVASVSLAANAAKTVSVGGQVVYAHTLVNTGNGPDSFNLAGVQSGSLAFASLQFFADANGDGVCPTTPRPSPAPAR